MSTLKRNGSGGGAWDHGLPRGITMKSIFEEENPYLTPYNSANRNAWLNNRRSLPTDKNSPELSYWYETGKFPNYSSYVHDTQDLDDPTEGRENNRDIKAWNQWRWNYQTEFEQNQAGGQSYQDLIDENNSGSTGGFTEQELIDAATDPTKTIVRDADGNVISIDDVVDPNTVTLDGSEATDAAGDSLGNVWDIINGGSNLEPPSNAPTLGNDPSFGGEEPVVFDNEEPTLGGTLGEITNGTGTDTTVEEPVTTVEEPVTVIDENINNDTGTGGTLNEVASPGYEIIGNVIYDADGNIIGTTGETAPGIAPVVGGASPTNPVFDEITAEQQAEIDRNAEAVALLDSGYGRYNAAVRKMGIIGRQGEEYAPLILDQLRMAEQEAAQPQFAAFGFGQNNMLGGMPQIGVQGVQGNVGGQSALSALSNAGLNQLNVGRQNYNRIALPDVGADGMPISQINNPTIFNASTNV